jgi:hypothetical protein
MEVRWWQVIYNGVLPTEGSSIVKLRNLILDYIYTSMMVLCEKMQFVFKDE